MRQEFKVSSNEESILVDELRSRTDSEALRITRYLNMPDLSRTQGSPLYSIVEEVYATKSLANLDNIIIPEIIPVPILFDLFGFPADHPARSRSDTYYADDSNVLRTHDTVMWYYYLSLPNVREKIARGENIGTICYGKVYRKDEIDSRHMNVFHQMGGLFLIPDSKGTLSIDDLKAVLSDIVKSVFSPNINFRFNADIFPYTDPSIEVEIEIDGKWVEVVGAGIPKRHLLEQMGITGYNGWAFGFGLERLAIISMKLPDIRLLWSTDPRIVGQLRMGQKYNSVSKYPPIVRDISFIVDRSFVPNDYFDIVREHAPGLIEEVSLLDKYEDEAKFGPDKISYAYRITYRSLERTLTSSEIDIIHKSLEEKTATVCSATIR